MPVSADHRLLRAILCLGLIFNNGKQRQIHHPLIRPDQLMKQFFLARHYPRDQPRLICINHLHDRQWPPPFYLRTSLASPLQKSRGTFRSKLPPLDTCSNPRSPANHNSGRLHSPSVSPAPPFPYCLSGSSHHPSRPS